MEEAAQGKTSLAVVIDAIDKPKGDGALDFDAAFNVFKQSVQQLGAQVQESNGRFWRVSASWHLGAEPPAPDSEGHSPLMALVPYGHVICGTCQSKLRCSLCRAHVTGATKGLFLQ